MPVSLRTLTKRAKGRKKEAVALLVLQNDRLHYRYYKMVACITGITKWSPALPVLQNGRLHYRYYKMIAYPTESVTCWLMFTSACLRCTTDDNDKWPPVFECVNDRNC
jgi:hypothetical protein